MTNILGKHSDKLYALLRIVAGFVFCCHGAQKLFGWFGGMGGSGGTAELMSLMGLAGIVEGVGGLLIMLGFLTGWAAFIASGEMAVAYFKAHFPNGTLPIQNGGDPATLFAFLFLYIASKGAGIWSIDAMRGK